MSNEVNDGVAEAIQELAKAVKDLAQQVHWGFRNEFDENVPDMLGKINNAIVKRTWHIQGKDENGKYLEDDGYNCTQPCCIAGLDRRENDRRKSNIGYDGMIEKRSNGQIS